MRMITSIQGIILPLAQVDGDEFRRVKVRV